MKIEANSHEERKFSKGRRSILLNNLFDRLNNSKEPSEFIKIHTSASQKRTTDYFSHDLNQEKSESAAYN